MYANENSSAFVARLVALVTLGLAGMSNCGIAANVATYKIQVSPNLETLNVSVTPSPNHEFSLLRPLSDDAWDRLDKSSLQGLSVRKEGLAPSPTARRYQYTTDIGGGVKGWIMGSFLMEVAVHMTDSRDWFWVPEKWQANDTIRVEFVMPEGLSVSVPWQRVSDEHYLARPVMLFNRSTVVFGQLELEQLTLPGGTLNLAIAAKTPQARDLYINWTRRVAETVVHEFGRLPVSSTQVVVMPTWFGSDPVPGGEVRRGNGSGLVLIPNTDATSSELMHDWTLYHEFTHLFHPYLGSEGRWVAEGIASYYQNVLRARAGVISAETAWQRLVAGFDRGKRKSRGGETVADGGLMRTYWTGAVMALELDMRLRQQVGITLSSVLGEFADCCLPAPRSWQPFKFMQRLDAISDTELFTDLYGRYSSSTEFPNHNDLLRELDIDSSEDTLTFGVSALRNSIMNAAVARRKDR